MGRRAVRNSTFRGVRLGLALVAGLMLFPMAAPRAQANASSTISLRDILQPPLLALQSAFQAVSTGELPAGYPTSADGWLVPESLLKAVAWTESKWQQFDAPRHTLISYDGGYGMMQITSGMRAGGLPTTTRSAIDRNFLFNLDFGAQLLVDKWLNTPNIGNDDPTVLEHWYYALWAYNGWSWTNNPLNPVFTRIGTPANNAAAFPYQERVFYWLAHPPHDKSGVPLWSPIPVTLPPMDEIGVTPGPLPETATPHYDISVAYPALRLSSDRNARFVADGTIPDDTVVAPGENFTKTWVLNNAGPASWTRAFHWTPVAGADLGHPGPVSAPTTPALADAAISARLTAPTAPGTYQQYWQMVGPDGSPFGVRAWVKIRVKSPASVHESATPRRPSPSATATVAGASADATPANSGLTSASGDGSTLNVVQASARLADTGDAAIYDGDVNVPDGTVFAPGAHFTKTWRIKNIGTTIWRPGYTWRFQAGTLLSAASYINVPTTAPGASATLSVQMTAPASTGVYTSFWQMANAGGQPFPHQAWVNIVVKSGSEPTETRAPVTPRSTATALPITATEVPTPVAQPTYDIPGGSGQFVASPWVGALAFRTYFPAGSTAGGDHETIGTYNPGQQTAHIRLTIFRPDAAQRVLQFTLLAGTRRFLALNRIAPGTGVSVVVESDRQIIAERLGGAKIGMLGSPGAARTARSWLFPAVPFGAPATQQLVLFNPHDQSVSVTVRVGLQAGPCCASIRNITVPPLRQFSYKLADQGLLQGPITLMASGVVAAERLAISPDRSVVVNIPGSVSPAQHWYMPSSLEGLAGNVTVFNPSSEPATVTIRTVLAEGSGPWLQRSVPAFSQVRVPFSQLSRNSAMAVQVDSTAPVIAGEEWSSGPSLMSAAIGIAPTSRHWGFIGGIAGRVAHESISIVNPSSANATVSVRILVDHGGGTLWTITMPPHSRYTRRIDNLIPSGGAGVIVDAGQLVCVQHVFTDQTGATLSPASVLSAP